MGKYDFKKGLFRLWIMFYLIGIPFSIIYLHNDIFLNVGFNNFSVDMLILLFTLPTIPPLLIFVLGFALRWVWIGFIMKRISVMKLKSRFKSLTEILFVLIYTSLLVSCSTKEKSPSKPDPEQILLNNMPSAITIFEQRIQNQISKIGNAYVFQSSNEKSDILNETTILDYAPPWKISCGSFGLVINFYILQTLDKAEGIGLDKIEVQISDAEFSDTDCKTASDRLLNKVKQQLGSLNRK